MHSRTDSKTMGKMDSRTDSRTDRWTVGQMDRQTIRTDTGH